ncbi:hypothetical protein BKA66DRAFT_589235 [Pyrenochaeta sp. MPI-SDFR-AT-0127]|nr:hypothetical protein BKA66DRAFT_589235 [Pyrenochaeta sp. MPI-SDFR-AT-0127]
MEDRQDEMQVPGIAALSQATARQIGSGQVLVDPSSAVKELIDNALDARAKSIFVDLATNTIDSIQVKDDGHGIPADDRALVCRRHCTSKIRDLDDLREVGGKWLGFRGEALSSMADVSGKLSITTRVEGEAVAATLKYGRNGELSSTVRESHPVGTTVKITNFFEHIPVRKQTAIKCSGKTLTKIRRLMQAYALARPAVRFRLHLLKAKNDKDDFVYAPKADANVEDVVLKVIGKNCALQCDWTALETDGFEIRAFLPKPTAIGGQLANHGAFVSVDARPMSNSRGTIRQVVAAVKHKLRKSNSSLGTVKDPFFCLHIICPPDSYDPNAEPAKDNVIFENGELVVGAVNRLLDFYYPEITVEAENFELPTIAQSCQKLQSEVLPSREHSPALDDNNTPKNVSDRPASEARYEQTQWRSSMYGSDEDDIGFLPYNQPPIVQEEEGLRAAALSNPWTIARMNAIVKPRNIANNGQLLSPAKSPSKAFAERTSVTQATTPICTLPAEPLTPRKSPRSNIPQSLLDCEVEQNTHHAQASLQERANIAGSREMLRTGGREPFNMLSAEDEGSTYIAHCDYQHSTSRPCPLSLAPRRSQQKQSVNTNKSGVPLTQGSNDTWFGQPMRSSGRIPSSHRPKRSKNQEVPYFVSDTLPNRRQSRLVTAGRSRPNELNSTDIRTFLNGNSVDRSEKFVDLVPAYENSVSRLRACRTSSSGSEDLSPLQDIAAPSSRTRRSLSWNVQDMDSFFNSHGESEHSSHDRPGRAERRAESHGIERTRSSKLPLERVPAGKGLQDLVLLMNSRIQTIIHISRKLDMSYNSLEWGPTVSDAYNVFVEFVTERKIMEWGIKLDEVLHEQYERLSGVDTRCELQEGIRKCFDARREEYQTVKMIENLEVPVIISDKSRSGVFNGGMTQRIDHEMTDTNIANHSSTNVQKDTDKPPQKEVEKFSDFDMSQFVNLDSDVPMSPVVEANEEDNAGKSDEYDADIEDEMLMDL